MAPSQCYSSANLLTIDNTTHAEATIMGYADCFALLGVVLPAAALAIAMLRKGADAGGMAH